MHLHGAIRWYKIEKNTLQIGKFEDLFHQPEVFMRMGRSIMAIPLPEEQLAARENAKAKASEEIGAKPKHRKPERDDH